jgi:hypothetical protein
MTPLPLHYKDRVILGLLPFLKHLNAGTLSVILAVVLALVSATHGTESGSRVAVGDNVTMAGVADDDSIFLPETLTLSGAPEATCFHSQSSASLTHSERPKRPRSRCD